MGVLLGWLFFLLFLGFVIGLIKPTLLKKKSRKEVVKLMLPLFLVWLGLLVMTSGLNDFLFSCVFIHHIPRIGLIKPAKIKMNSRKKAFLIMGSSFLTLFILSMVTLPDVTSEETLVLEQKKIEEQEKEQKIKVEKESEELAKTEELEKQREEEKELEEQEKAKALEEQNKREEEERIAKEEKAKELEEQKRAEEELARQKAAEAEAARVASTKSC